MSENRVIPEAVWQEAAHQANITIDRDFGDEGDPYFRHSYSGRGMYGDACFGVVGHPRDVTKWLIALNQAVNDLLESDDEIAEALGDLDEAFVWELVDSMRDDNLGRDTITYFPGWSLEGGDSDD